MLDSLGCEYKRKGGVFEVLRDSKVVLVGENVNDIFIIKTIEMLNEVSTSNLIEANLWQKILSHIDKKKKKKT